MLTLAAMSRSVPAMGFALPSMNQPAIAGRIQSVLKTNQWSQRELGRRAGFSAQSQMGNLLRRLECGGAVEIETLIAVATGAQVPLAWLITGQGYSPLEVASSSPPGPESLRQANRVCALRIAMGLTHKALIETAHPHFVCPIESIEAGSHSLDSAAGLADQELLARGFGLAIGDLRAFLAGEVTLRDAVRWAKQGRASAVCDVLGLAPTSQRTLLSSPPQASIPLWDDALGKAFDGQRHALADLDAARVLRQSAEGLQALGVELFSFARLALDVSETTRRKSGRAIGGPDLVGIFRVLLSRSPGADGAASHDTVDPHATKEGNVARSHDR